jgi:hypothetical protein
MWETNDSWWQGPVAISPAGAVPPAAHIATAHGGPGGDQLYIFYVDWNGVVNYQWTAPLRWSDRVGITAPSSAPAGAPLATARQGSDQTDLFWIDNHGAAQVRWMDGNGVWRGQWQMTPQGFAWAGSSVAAILLDGQTYLFMTDNGQGGVVHGGSSGNNLWAMSTTDSWASTTPVMGCDPGATLSAIHEVDLDNVSVYCVESDGSLQMLQLSGLYCGGIDGAAGVCDYIGLPLSGSNFAATGAPVAAAVRRFPQTSTQTDVFVATSTGLNAVWFTGGNPGAPWYHPNTSGPLQVYPVP